MTYTLQIIIPYDYNLYHKVSILWQYILVSE